MGIGTNLSILLFCILFSFRVGGFPTGFESLLYGYSTDVTTGLPFGIGGTIPAGSTAGVPSMMGVTLMIGLFVALFSVGGAIGSRIFSTASGSSQSVIYTIPLAMVTGFLITFFLFPMSFILEPSIPLLIREFVLGFLSLLVILTTVSFVRGVEP